MILEQNQGANTRGKGKEKKVSEEEVSTCRRGPTIGQSVDGHNGDNALQRVRLSQVCCGGHSLVGTQARLCNDWFSRERLNRSRDTILDRDGSRRSRYRGILVSEHVGDDI